MTSRADARRVRQAFEVALVCICFLLGPNGLRLAHAQSGAGSQAGSGNETYRALIEQALLEFRHKNWPEARILFRRAHELSPSARTLRGMGVVSYEMRDYVRAVRDLSAALNDPRQPLSYDQRSEAETLLSRARTFVGVYSLTVDPANASVALDGAPLQREGDGTVLLAFGEHTLTANLDGYEAARTHLSVQGGERGEVALTLVPKVGTQDELAVFPAPQPETSPPRPVDPPREPTQTGRLRFTWVALASGALLGGASGAIWLLGKKELDDLDERCAKAARAGAPCTEANTDTDKVENYALMTNIALGLTGAAAVATAILAVYEWPRTERRPVEVSLGPRFLSVRGEF